MTNIFVYDVDAEEINKIADDNELSVAEVIEMLMEYEEGSMFGVIHKTGISSEVQQ